MKSVLILGAGRSSHALLHYLLTYAQHTDVDVVIGDQNINAVQERIKGYAKGRAVHFSLHDDASTNIIESSDVVVSLLPADLHPAVAKLCLRYKKHLLTASYVSDAMRSLHDDALQSNILLLNECGLDPGIDHMTAAEIIDRTRTSGGRVISFESFTGGLIAPDTDVDNPWRYKFTWNPRNVVMAGQGTAKFLQDGEFKYIPYQQLFQRTTPIHVPGFGDFEGYANRDSLTYREIYALHDIKTIIRGTLRHHGFCKAWNILVQLGCCDDNYFMEGIDGMSHRKFISAFLPSNHKNAEQQIADMFGLHISDPALYKLQWSGLFDDEPIGLKRATPAQALEYILNKKWKLASHDKDMIVMWHRFITQFENETREILASLAAIGKNETDTAMAKTVGLPLGIVTKLLIEGKIKSRGVCIPVAEEFYTPVLHELRTLGIVMNETERRITHNT